MIGSVSWVKRLTDYVAVDQSVYDAVDGSSTGTKVPKMWALFKAPTIRRS
jgi:hypothetical protein